MAKKAAKKTAKIATTKTTESPGKNKKQVISVSDDPSSLQMTSESLEARGGVVKETMALMRNLQASKSNTVCNLRTAAEVKQEMLRVPELVLQWMLGAFGLPLQRVIEIIGREGLGKTSLTLTILGWAIKYTGTFAALYIETENKPMNTSRILRMMDTDPETAKAMASNIIFEDARSLTEMINKIELWAKTVRGELAEGGKSVCIRKSTPIFAVVDTISKLMSKEEEVGYYAYGNNMDEKGKKKAKDTGETGNQGHAKFHQQLGRRLPYILSHYNITLIVVSHQNVKFDMSGAKSFMPQDASDLYNKVKLGGVALNQNASVQLIVAYKQQVKSTDKTVIAKDVKMRVDKNSYGPGGRVIEYRVVMDQFLDTDGYLEPALNFDDFTARWFADNRILGTSVSSKRYTCDALGIVGATSYEFAESLKQQPEMIEKIAKSLSIEGYNDVVTDIVAKVSPGSVGADDEEEVPEGPPEDA